MNFYRISVVVAFLLNACSSNPIRLGPSIPTPEGGLFRLAYIHNKALVGSYITIPPKEDKLISNISGRLIAAEERLNAKNEARVLANRKNGISAPDGCISGPPEEYELQIKSGGSWQHVAMVDRNGEFLVSVKDRVVSDTLRKLIAKWRES